MSEPYMQPCTNEVCMQPCVKGDAHLAMGLLLQRHWISMSRVSRLLNKKRFAQATYGTGKLKQASFVVR